jgi:hypothetical protein
MSPYRYDDHSGNRGRPPDDATNMAQSPITRNTEQESPRRSRRLRQLSADSESSPTPPPRRHENDTGMVEGEEPSEEEPTSSRDSSKGPEQAKGKEREDDVATETPATQRRSRSESDPETNKNKETQHGDNSISAKNTGGIL